MDDQTIACPGCHSPLTRRTGVIVTGVCDVCGRNVEFELPPHAIEELTDDLIDARKAKTADAQNFEARKIFALAANQKA